MKRLIWGNQRRFENTECARFAETWRTYIAEEIEVSPRGIETDTSDLSRVSVATKIEIPADQTGFLPLIFIRSLLRVLSAPELEPYSGGSKVQKTSETYSGDCSGRASFV